MTTTKRYRLEPARAEIFPGGCGGGGRSMSPRGYRALLRQWLCLLLDVLLLPALLLAGALRLRWPPLRAAAADDDWKTPLGPWHQAVALAGALAALDVAVAPLALVALVSHRRAFVMQVPPLSLSVGWQSVADPPRLSREQGSNGRPNV